PGTDFVLALDPAASEFYRQNAYALSIEKKSLSSDELIDYYAAWVDEFPIKSIEDGLAEDDWDGFKNLTQRIGDQVQTVGDDLFVTNVERLQKGIDQKAANAILVKPNQIGTLTETVDVITKAQQAGFATIISHRSGETEDTFIADLAVACNAGQIKTGAPCRSERVAKYNRLLMIEQELSGMSYYSPFK
ncbi:MAG TPA: phosphopyruvate hydratase, partial [Patescibacteria group bacterium]|nr:phosphopyruvate hydratase [Patescibacteria group bacterium]